MTAGQTMTAKLCDYFNIGSRTRRIRGDRNLINAINEAVTYAATQPGYYTESTQQALRVGYYAVLTWEKHVGGCRLNGEQLMKLNTLTPLQYAKLLGRMVDDGVTNSIEAEVWFRKERMN